MDVYQALWQEFYNYSCQMNMVFGQVKQLSETFQEKEKPGP